MVKHPDRKYSREKATSMNPQTEGPPMEWWEDIVLTVHLWREWLLGFLILMFFVSLGVALFVSWKAAKTPQIHR